MKLSLSVTWIAGLVFSTRDRRSLPAETWAARRPQARRRGDGVCRDGAHGGPGAQRTGLAATDSRPLWSRRAPVEPRARLATRGKKTPLSDLPDVTSGVPETATLVASYEALRRIALGQRGPDDRASLGVAILLRQGS